MYTFIAVNSEEEKEKLEAQGYILWATDIYLRTFIMMKEEKNKDESIKIEYLEILI